MQLFKRLVQACWWEGLVPPDWWVELGFVPLVGRAMSRAVFSGQLWAHEDFQQPVCYVSALLGCLASGIPALELIGCLGRVWSWWENSGFQECSCHSEYPRTPAACVFVPTVSHSCACRPPPTTVQENLLYQQVGLTQAQALMKPLLTPPGSWCIWDLVCDLQKWNFSFPQSCNLIPLTFKARFSESSSLHCQTLSLGSLM